MKKSLPKFDPHRNSVNILLTLAKASLIISISLLLGWYLIPNLIHSQVAKYISISPDQSPEFYKIWIKPPIPVYFKVTLFNVSNPNEIEAGMKPRFKEVGPYVFQEIRTKVNISFDDPSDTATYTEHVRFEFRGELSGNLSIHDKFTMINLPFVAATIKVERDVPWPLNHVAHMILLNYKETLFVQKTVEDALFKGWKVPFLEQIEEEIGLTFLKNNTFGFFVDMNDTNQGPYTIQRGIRGDKRLLGKMVKYRNEPTLPFWGARNSSCNKLKGTDAFIFPPFNSKDTVLEAFNSDLCGSLYLHYNGEAEVEGVHGYRFTIPPAALEAPRKSVENRCFCQTIDSEPEKCLGRGALDLGPCRDGAPVALTLPHFLNADPMYLREIADGVKPDKGKHETFVDIEPLTGIVLHASKRIQLNLMLRKVPSIPSLRKVKEMLFPCVWAEEGARLDEPNAQRLQTILLLIKISGNVSKYGTPLLATIVLAIMLRKAFTAMTHDNNKYKSSHCAENLLHLNVT